MIGEIQKKFKSIGSLVCTNVNWDGNSLNLNGEKWAVSISSSWRIIKNRNLMLGLDEDFSTEDLESFLTGEIIAIEPQSPASGLDPAFTYTSGARLEVFSDIAVEPWTMKLPNSDLVYVASPTNNNGP